MNLKIELFRSFEKKQFQAFLRPCKFFFHSFPFSAMNGIFVKPQRALKNSACLLKACRHDYHGDEDDDDCGPSIGPKKFEQHRLIRKETSDELFSCQ